MVGLFHALNTSDQALRTQQVGIQTVAHNIANANTEGFHRQRVDFVTALPQELGSFKVGSGVMVQKIRRIIDLALEANVRRAEGDQAALEERSNALVEIESLFNEFTDADLTTTLQNFFDSVENLVTTPESVSVRKGVINEAQVLADRIGYVANRLNLIRQNINESVDSAVREINTRLERVAELNREIVISENGGLDFDSAADLRDERDHLIEELAEFMDVRVRENSVGSATVTVGGELLVFGGRFFRLSTQQRNNREVPVSDVFIDGSLPLPETGGRLGGLLAARDELAVEFIDTIDTFARDLIFEFNKLHTEGRGLERFRSLTSEVGVNNRNFSTVPLATNGTATAGGQRGQLTASGLSALATGDDFFNGLQIRITSGANAGQVRTVLDYDNATGTLFFDQPFEETFAVNDTFQISSLPYLIQNGSFQLIAVNEGAGTETAFNINVDLDGLGGAATDTKLDDIITQINAGFGAFVGNASAASRTTDGRLAIDISGTNFRFAFASDTSNFLAAIGLNTFYTGKGALDIGVRDGVEANANFVAAARTSSAGDNTNAVALAALAATRVSGGGRQTLDENLDAIISSLGTQSRSAQDRLDSQTVLTTNLLTQREAISGVSLDEEATQLLKFQRSFQASARLIGIVDELLATLLNSI